MAEHSVIRLPIFGMSVDFSLNVWGKLGNGKMTGLFRQFSNL